MSRMKRLEYTVRFVTPAFLGGADQSAQWRTPPFKALIRQWWRVAAASNIEYDVARLRRDEGKLFGAANEEGGGSQKSQVRLRLGTWSLGQLQGAWGDDPRVNHPEVGPNGREVGAHLYLGYGPLKYQQGTALKENAAIQAGESSVLRLAWPNDEATITDVLQLIQWFGTIGSRSRNGWGSILLRHESIVPVIPAQAGIQEGLLWRVSRPLHECLTLDWPHAIGRSADDRLLVWKSAQTFAIWREAMQVLAKVKIGFRTQFRLGAAGPFESRHLLAYPVTNHSVYAWDNQVRLANQLRFKVAANAEGRLMALIYHLPCGLPRELADKLGRQAPGIQKQVEIWLGVHDYLDDPAHGFTRI